MYDPIYRLTQVMQSANTTESYSYDPVGNRLSSLRVSSYTTNTSNELTGTSSATYDYNGNTQTKTDSTGTTTYTWDFENRLISVALPGTGGTVSFKYDPFGRRIYKSSSSGTSIFAYDGDNLIEETSSNGAVVARYTQGENIDEPLAMLRSTATNYYEVDGLGSVTSLSNVTGVLAQTYGYDSFGKQAGSSGSLTNPFEYAGRELDSETGLYFYRARFYDPNSGRFLSEDPIEFEGGINFYSYVENNPLNSFDPWGLKLCKVNLPGLGPTYLDDAFYPRVKQWIDSNGADRIPVDFTQAFRTTEKQASLANDPSAVTPAKPGTSLHEAGFAVDVAWSRIPRQLRPLVVANAKASGLVWGGDFKHPRPDPVHFQRDPGSRKDRIPEAQKEYKKGVTCDCK